MNTMTPKTDTVTNGCAQATDRPNTRFLVLQGHGLLEQIADNEALDARARSELAMEISKRDGQIVDLKDQIVAMAAHLTAPMYVVGVASSETESKLNNALVEVEMLRGIRAGLLRDVRLKTIGLGAFKAEVDQLKQELLDATVKLQLATDDLAQAHGDTAAGHARCNELDRMLRTQITVTTSQSELIARMEAELRHREPERTFTKDQWFEVMKIAVPSITREAFDAHWEDFQARKAAGQLEGQAA